jgi:hypothetical protein
VLGIFEWVFVEVCWIFEWMLVKIVNLQGKVGLGFKFVVVFHPSAYQF